MGYYITLQDANFTIPADKLDEATRRLKALNHKPGVYKRGGSYSGGKQAASWFSWMSEKYDEELDSAKEIFEALGFDTETNEAGDLSLVYYDNKTGQEDLFLQEVSDLANEGWYLQFHGEDGAIFRYTAQGERKARIVW